MPPSPSALPRGPSLTTPSIHPSQVTVSTDALGRGSFGTVFRGTFSGCPVAVKVCHLPPPSRSPSTTSAAALAARSAAVQFRRETARYQCLRHPCIVQFFCVVAAPPRLLLVTELMKGGSLFAALSALSAAGFTRLPTENLLRIAQHVAHGLAYLHATRFSFGDLKSLNILLSLPPDLRAGTLPPAAHAKLCDFGLSRNLNHLVRPHASPTRPEESSIPARHGPAGTFAYLAPEAFRGLPTDDPDAPKRADVYALGIVLWELATLQKPWPGLRPLQLIGLVGREGRRPEWPLDLTYLPHGFVDLVERCWHQDPLQRPSVDHVAAELESMYADLPRANEHGWDLGRFKGSAKEVISLATDETVTEDVVSEDGSLSDDWDIVQVDEEEHVSEEDLQHRRLSWTYDTQHTGMSTITGESQRSTSISRASVHSEVPVPELEIKRVISYMLPPGWQDQQHLVHDDTHEAELDKELLEMSERSEPSPRNRDMSLTRRESRKAAYRRLREAERRRSYTVPPCLQNDEVEHELADLAGLNEDWQKTLFCSNASPQSDKLELASRDNSKLGKQVSRSYSLPEDLATGSGDMDEMLKMLDEVPDIFSVGVDMYSRPHFR